jgi:hypothetical protein
LTAFDREVRRRPDIVRDYRARLERLQREHPLREPINVMAEEAVVTILQRLPPQP